jgi:ClpX C4-type zinc finger protein
MEDFGCSSESKHEERGARRVSGFAREVRAGALRLRKGLTARWSFCGRRTRKDRTLVAGDEANVCGDCLKICPPGWPCGVAPDLKVGPTYTTPA